MLFSLPKTVFSPTCVLSDPYVHLKYCAFEIWRRFSPKSRKTQRSQRTLCSLWALHLFSVNSVFSFNAASVLCELCVLSQRCICCLWTLCSLSMLHLLSVNSVCSLNATYVICELCFLIERCICFVRTLCSPWVLCYPRHACNTNQSQTSQLQSSKVNKFPNDKISMWHSS